MIIKTAALNSRSVKPRALSFVKCDIVRLSAYKPKAV